jgi:hypothetical protein
METSKKLVLEDAEINKLLIKELDWQLDFHHVEEKKLPVPMAVKLCQQSHCGLCALEDAHENQAGSYFTVEKGSVEVPFKKPK